MRIPGVPFVQGLNDYEDRDGRKYGIAIHNTSNDASDEGEASYATHRPDGISAHFYADGDSVTQSVDTDDRVGHAGSYEGNEHAVAYELTGTNAKSRQWWLDNIAWDKVAYTIAYQLKHDPDFAGFQIRRATVAEMKANPKVRAFYSHDDMRRAWGGTTHTDPGPNFPWDRLFRAVNDALNGDDMTPAEMLAAQIKNPVTGELATVAEFFQSINREAYTARLAAQAALAKVGGDLVDEQAIVAGVLAGLTPQAIAAAIPAEFARQVADELRDRLAS